MSTTSARTPSAASRSSTSAKSPRSNRAAQPSSGSSSAKRSAADGSRSIAIRVPVGPIRSAARVAWPPPPNVQSTTTSPGAGSTSAISSGARTGTCSAGM